MRRNGFPTRSVVMAAMCAAVFAVLAQITIPLPSGIPITLQTFAAALCGYVLGWKWGLAAVATYLMLGAVGLPVFSGFRGGVSVLIGMTGGYLWGFLPFAALCGVGVSDALNVLKRKILVQFLLGLAGLAVCHMAGIAQFAALTQRTVRDAFLLASLPYLIKDAVSVLCACLAAAYFRKRRVIG